MNEKNNYTIYCNGEYVLNNEAKISPFDLGFSHGDGIYDIMLQYNKKFIDIEEHLKRLNKMANVVNYNNIPSNDEIRNILLQLQERNPHIINGLVFIQITRGMSFERYIKMLSLDSPTIIIYITPIEIDLTNYLQKQICENCLLINDDRRERCDIKITSLMPSNLGKIKMEKNGFNYVMYKNRITQEITEGVSSNIFMITKNDEILTHPLDNSILEGTLRSKIIQIFQENGYKVSEVRFFEKDILEAKEVFATGSIKLIKPILKINNNIIGDGKIGTLTKLIFDLYSNKFLK